MTPADETHSRETVVPASPDGPGVVLLVWDAPNVDMGLGSILGGRPTAVYRPRFDALGRWLLGYTADLSASTQDTLEAEATVFTNIVAGTSDNVRPWVEALRNVGFAVFAKPKTSDDSDVDEDMLEHIDLRAESGRLAGVVVASADGQAFREPLEELAEDIPITVIGFREHATWAVQHDTISFIDLEDIPGVFREPLPRVSLDNLPDEALAAAAPAAHRAAQLARDLSLCSTHSGGSSPTAASWSWSARCWSWPSCRSPQRVRRWPGRVRGPDSGCHGGTTRAGGLRRDAQVTWSSLPDARGRHRRPGVPDPIRASLGPSALSLDENNGVMSSCSAVPALVNRDLGVAVASISSPVKRRRSSRTSG